MRYYQVRTSEDALAYILDCNLATVEGMAMKKSRPSGEYARQIAIAQKTYDWAIKFGSDISQTRGADIKTTVEDWAKQYEVRK